MLTNKSRDYVFILEIGRFCEDHRISSNEKFQTVNFWCFFSVSMAGEMLLVVSNYLQNLFSKRDSFLPFKTRIFSLSKYVFKITIWKLSPYSKYLFGCPHYLDQFLQMFAHNNLGTYMNTFRLHISMYIEIICIFSASDVIPPDRTQILNSS